MNALEIDLETRSRLDLTKVGAHVYFEHPSTEIILGCWAIGDDPIEAWYPGEPCPRRIVDHIRAGGEIRGWHVGFERLAWNTRLGPWHNWPPIPPLAQYSDNAALAAAMALPRALEDAAVALGLEEQKDIEGHRLMLQMSRPQKDGTFLQDFDRMVRLTAYCEQDVRTSRAVRKKLRPLSALERSLWLLDQRINDRGVAIDRELVAVMDEIVSRETLRLNEILREATGGAVAKLTQTVALARWLRAQGVDCASLGKEHFDFLLGQDMPDNARAALLARIEGAKSSTSKLIAAKIATSADGRARGMLLFNGASTGRWSGRLLQPHNMLRGSGTTDPAVSIPLMKDYGYAAVQFCYPWPMTAVADAMRGIIVAADGKKFYSADYKGVEARLTAWLAGDGPKLAQFRRADAGEGPGMYELAAAGIYGVPVEEIDEDDPRRQTGKTAELALGFGGGVNALLKMALGYGIDMGEAYVSLMDTTDGDKRREVIEKYEKSVKTGNTNIPARTWIACELTKQKWRKQNPLTVQAWRLIEDMAWKAMQGPRTEPLMVAGIPVGWQWIGGFLRLLLPSGRPLFYGNPRVRSVEVPWSDKTVPREARERKQAVTVLGIDSQTHKFIRYPLYPGLGFQHAVQGTARDLLANGMLLADKTFPMVLTVHDELLAEVDADAPPLSAFTRLVCQLPYWAHGIPLVADGWEGPRYKKK
jgi:DNA polymerase bacteriophage-type